MIVIKVELWPRGFEEKKKELSRMYIANTGTNPDPSLGNYKVALMKKGTKNPPWKIGDGSNELSKPFRIGNVDEHPRIKQHVMHLVRKAIDAIY